LIKDLVLVVSTLTCIVFSYKYRGSPVMIVARVSRHCFCLLSRRVKWIQDYG